MTEQLSARVGKLEDDVSALKVETGKITITLENMKERQEERHAYVVKGIDKIEESLDTLTKPHTHSSAPSKWLKEIITPQTIAIILAVLASALGAPMVAQQLLGATVATPSAVERIETQPSPSTQP